MTGVISKSKMTSVRFAQSFAKFYGDSARLLASHFNNFNLIRDRRAHYELQTAPLEGQGPLTGP